MRSKIQAKAFNYLENLKLSHKKVKMLKHKGVKMQPYLKDSNMSTEKKQLLFKLRTRMFDVKENFSYLYLDSQCTFGCNEGESQEHLLNCSIIIKHCSKLSDDLEVEYEDIGGSLEKQIKFINLYKCVVDTRNDLMKRLISTVT